MAYVPQNPLLLNDSIKNNITLCNDKFSEEDIIKAAKQAEIHDFITLLPDNYNTIIGDRGCNLSGGQQQCISLARAFIKDSPILLIDEGTAALDPELESYVMSNIINDMNKKTMIIVSHKISTVLNADYIYVFNDGKIIESGTPKELCQCNGYFSSMAKLQNIKI
jgi:ABC-type multidrug transport system fused ATPase/permease subunit